MSAVAHQVTVVIPAWGAYAGDQLDRAIAGIRAQDIEADILVVDNADPEGVNAPGARVLRSERRVSIGAARQLGLEAVETPLVVFWDADDEMPPGTLKRLVAAMDEDEDLVACGASIIDGHTGERHHWPRRWPLALSARSRLFATVNAVASLYGIGGAVVRTGPARQAGFPDVEGGDDWAMGVALAFRGRVRVLDEPGRIYHYDAGSVSSAWTWRERMAHARLVRSRLRTDPTVPRAVRVLLPLVATAQTVVILLLRPLARLMPRRRRQAST